MGITVSRLEPDQYAEVASLCVQAYLPSRLPSDHAYYARLRDVAARDEQAEVWVATEHGRVLGTLTWCPTGSPWREIARDDEAEFRMLAVDPEEQGRGVGRALVDAAITRARAEGRTGVVLSTACWMTAAHHLYERMGFERIPERDWSPTEGLDLKAYWLDLATSERP